MHRRYATADVFTTRPLGGNPVAVVLDAEGLTAAQMQALAAEFNYVETTFVLPPSNPNHTARVRIFTPDREVPFAGHPNIGTAFLLARQQAERGEEPFGHFLFEEEAGLVELELLREDGVVVGAELLSPQPLSRHATVPPAQAAACLHLALSDVYMGVHPPCVVSVGLPFLVVELASREALRRARPDRQAYESLFPLDGARSVYAYTRDGGPSSVPGYDLHSRMFTSRMVEDPATGSATATVTGLLATLRGADVQLRVLQGEDMGRPSTLLSRSVIREGTVRARVGGYCATMFRGVFDLG